MEKKKRNAVIGVTISATIIIILLVTVIINADFYEVFSFLIFFVVPGLVVTLVSINADNQENNTENDLVKKI